MAARGGLLCEEGALVTGELLREQIRRTVAGISPADPIEVGEQASVLAWIDSGAPLFRDTAPSRPGIWPCISRYWIPCAVAFFRSTTVRRRRGCSQLAIASGPKGARGNEKLLEAVPAVSIGSRPN
ncbi:hypothetical protein GCM10012284_11780 [Mangrovihabitans endophyticus]|uniref:Uncharacterized protein n=1 Tax=Mangrovihabitans endophyticus TaxID=1751298 RepID=A0A8J3FMW9_9ACTN|nr:hypothetical protein GCM10012284_11780 [Mangrovihabitans endophyticus]